MASLQEQHRDLALALLVARSLASGLPWSLDEDRSLIARERILWAGLSDLERQDEQTFLAQLWDKRGATRLVAPNPSWGPWAASLGESPVNVPDEAFGPPQTAYRPSEKGIEALASEHPEVAPLLGQLWLWGFHTIKVTSTELILSIPAHRVMQETERLVGMLTRSNRAAADLFLSQPRLEIVGAYDHVSGRAWITVSNYRLLI